MAKFPNPLNTQTLLDLCLAAQGESNLFTLGTKKKRMWRVPPEPTIVSDTPIKTMDGNPLGQSRDISLDDQDTPRMDYNDPAKINDHKVKSRMWVSAPLTKQKKEDISKYEKFFCGLPKETVEKTFDVTTRLGRIITGETLWLEECS